MCNLLNCNLLFALFFLYFLLIFSGTTKCFTLLEGKYDGRDYHGVFISGNYAYVADIGGVAGSLRIIDITNPFFPQKAECYSNPPIGVRSVYVSGNYACVTDGCCALTVIDISNPSSPQEVGYYDNYDII